MGTFSREHLIEDYEACGRNAAKLARQYGTSPSSIHKALKKLGYKKDSFDLDGWNDDEISGVAEAIIRQAIKDYKRALSKGDSVEARSLERFFRGKIFSVCCGLVSTDDFEHRMRSILHVTKRGER